MTTYQSYGVNLSKNQKIKLTKAIQNKSSITLRLSKSELSGDDYMMLTQRQINQIQKAKSLNKGLDLKISKTQISKIVQRGGSLFTSLISLGTKLLPTVTKVATKVLPGLASGAVHSLGNFGMDKILGNGLQNRPYNQGNGLRNRGSGLENQQQSGWIEIPQNKLNIEKLIANKHLLTKSQKQQLLNSQTDGPIFIKQTKSKRGGFLGTLLASIGVPMLLKAVTGGAMQNRRPYYGKGQKKTTKNLQGSGILLGPNSPLKNVPFLGTIV